MQLINYYTKQQVNNRHTNCIEMERQGTGLFFCSVTILIAGCSCSLAEAGAVLTIGLAQQMHMHHYTIAVHFLYKRKICFSIFLFIRY